MQYKQNRYITCWTQKGHKDKTIRSLDKSCCLVQDATALDTLVFIPSHYNFLGQCHLA